ncbi:MAG: hypothetical protein GYA57_14285 [Myxococcales bacterium]|nr:hypothetical protein [Myxococcales bacterium]
MRRRWTPLVVVLIGLAGCSSPSARDADDAAEAGQPDGGEAVDVDARDATDSVLDDADRTDVDPDADVVGEAEGWDFGADLWDPERSCGPVTPGGPPREDEPALVAPPCGEGCRQVAFAAEPWGRFAVSDRWLAYESRYRTWVVDLESGEESVLFCHPYFVGSYGLAVDDEKAGFAIGTHFMVDESDVNYAAIWMVDLASHRSWPIREWTRPHPAEMTEPAELEMDGGYFVFSSYDSIQVGPADWVQHGNIYVADVRTGAVEPVMDRDWPSCFGWPDIGGEWVVYSTTAAVLAYKIERGVTIGRDIPGDQIRPRTDGVNVVWLDHRNYPGGYMSGGGWDIYSYDFEAGTELRITSESHPVGEDAAPDVLGDVVVWSDKRNATPEDPYHSDLFLYRYSTGREQQLTFATGAVYRPRLAGDRVYFVWIPTPLPPGSPERPDRAICEQILPPP